MKLIYLRLIPVICMIFLLSGCATIRLDANDLTFPVGEEVVPDYKEGQAIAVHNYYLEPVIVTLTSRIEADLMQYTDTAIKALAQGLKHRNISVGAEGSKSIILRVHDAKLIMAFWTLQVEVNITAELGNGKTFTVFHHNASPATAFRAASGAITRATEKILNHNDFIQYMND